MDQMSSKTRLRRDDHLRQLWVAGVALNRATIDRNLLSLTEAGLLVKTQLGDSVWRCRVSAASVA